MVRRLYSSTKSPPPLVPTHKRTSYNLTAGIVQCLNAAPPPWCGDIPAQDRLQAPVHSTAVHLPSSLARVNERYLMPSREKSGDSGHTQNKATDYDGVIAGVYSSVMPRKVEKRETVPEQSEQVQQENEVANATGRGLGVMLDFR